VELVEEDQFDAGDIKGVDRTEELVDLVLASNGDGLETNFPAFNIVGARFLGEFEDH